MTRERFIRKTLRKLSRQRVALILQPGGFWVIEKSIRSDEKTEAALRTCYMRGWVEPIVDAIPKGKLTKEGKLPDNPIFTEEGPVYRLTDSGWNVIHRIYGWIVATSLLAMATLIAAIITLYIAT